MFLSVRSAVAGVDNDDLAGQPGSRQAQGFPGPKVVGTATGDDRRESGKCLEGAGSASSVCRQPHVALELPQCLTGARAEDSVDPAHFEPQLGEPPLQAEHVITRLRVGDHIGQQTVTKPPSGLVEHAIGRSADDPVG